MQCSLEYIWRPRPTPTGYQCALSSKKSVFFKQRIEEEEEKERTEGRNFLSSEVGKRRKR